MKYQIQIPSRGRADLCAQNPVLEDACVFVHESEKDTYEEAFSRAQRHPLALLTHNVSGIPNVRNVMLDARCPDDVFLFHVDDDVDGIQYVMTFRPITYKEIGDCRAIIERTAQLALDAHLGMFGFSRAGPLHERRATSPFSLRSWIDASAMGIIDRTLRFDPKCITAEDLDLSLQSMANDRICLTDLRYKFGHDRWSAGGMSGSRNDGTVAASVAHLQRKWGRSVIRQAPDRRMTGQALAVNL